VARPSKYNWDAIKEAYEGGLDIEDIIKKFRITKKILNNRIHLKEWIVKGYIEADIKGFSASLGTLAQNGTKHPEIADMIVEKLNTTLQDNELISNNRKLAKLLQSVVIREKDNINLKNIKNVSGVLRDIEAIANPTVNNKVEINNSNQQATIPTINISIDE